MTRKFVLTISIPAILFCFGCEKGNVSKPSAIVGNWYENKLTLIQTNSKTSVTKDTTFQGPNFTPGDYFKFSAADTASVWNDGSYFTLQGKFWETNPSESEFFYRSYRVEGSLLILQAGFVPACANCSQPGPDTVKIIQLDAHNLVLQSPLPDTSQVYTGTATTYYVR